MIARLPAGSLRETAAFAAANLPFLNDRWLIVGKPARAGAKPFVARLAELVRSPEPESLAHE